LPELRRPSSHQPPPAYIPPSGLPSGYIPPSGNSSRRASSTHMEVSRQHQLVSIWFVWKLIKLFACFVKLVTFIYKNKPNLSKLYQIRRTVSNACPIRRTVMFICKIKPKTPISGRLPGEPAGSSVLPTPKFRPIQRYLAPNLAVGDANDWRCS
jgi:hypothetical protein